MMSDAAPAGVVVDTMVISWLFDDRPNPLADRYRALIGPVPVLHMTAYSTEPDGWC